MFCKGSEAFNSYFILKRGGWGFLAHRMCTQGQGCVPMVNTYVHKPVYMHARRKAELNSFSYFECDSSIKTPPYDSHNQKDYSSIDFKHQGPRKIKLHENNYNYPNEM